MHIMLSIICALSLSYKFCLTYFFKENGSACIEIFYYYLLTLIGPFMLGAVINYAKAKNNDRMVLILSLAVGIINLILDYVLGKIYGPIGIAYATLISLFSVSIFGIFFVLKEFKTGFYLIFLYFIFLCFNRNYIFVIVLTIHLALIIKYFLKFKTLKN